MVVTVELADLRARLESDSVTGSSAAFPIFLLMFVLCDAVAAFHGHGVVLPAIAATIPGRDGVELDAWLAAAVHFILVGIGFQQLLRAPLPVDSIPEADLLETVRGRGALTRSATIWLGVLVPAFLITIVMLTSAGLPTARAGSFLRLMAIIACPIAVAALLARGWHAFRTLADRGILFGAAAGLGAVLAGWALIAPVEGVASSAAGRWVALFEAAAQLSVAIVLLAAMLPRQRRIYTVSVDRPDDAPLLVPFNPFRFRARSQRYLTFDASEGQIVVLTRRSQAPHWQSFDATDAQNQLPLSDREVQIWNLTRLSEQLAQPISARDREGCFQMNLQIGRAILSAKLPPGRSYSTGAITAVNNMLFQNRGLAGLLSGAAGRALQRRLANGGDDHIDRIAHIQAFLNRAPNSITLLRDLDLSRSVGPTELTAAKLRAAIESACGFLDDLMDRREELNAIIRAAQQAASALDREWLEEVATDIRQRGIAGPEQRGLDMRQVMQVLELIGLRIASSSVVPDGMTVSCQTRLESAGLETSQLIEAAWEQHCQATGKAADRVAEMELHGTRRGALSGRHARAVIIRRLTSLDSASTPSVIRRSDPIPPPPTEPDDGPGEQDEPLN